MVVGAPVELLCVDLPGAGPVETAVEQQQALSLTEVGLLCVAAAGAHLGPGKHKQRSGTPYFGIKLAGT